MEFRTCGKCEHYSRVLLRCTLKGIINPKTKKDTLETMRTMGISYVCGFNKFKHICVREMHENKENMTGII